ncbi:MAG: bacteriochlorophyll 4-vinyl reductase [Gemmatimonadales bacterium]|nr:bacteriochlorophyll 4-vinyl reductase [Gemmatimonadales bacterium]
MVNLAHTEHPPQGARLIGPNALIQTAAALEQLEPAAQAHILAAAGEDEVTTHPPEAMVDERRFSRLVVAVVERLGVERAARVLERSGELTAEYLLAHRIPVPFQWLVRRLPSDLGLRLLLGAIGSHAWTFAGSGTFRYELLGGGRVRLHIEDCPACRELADRRCACGFYAGTFARLFREMIDGRMDVRAEPCAEATHHCCAMLAQPADEG